MTFGKPLSILLLLQAMFMNANAAPVYDPASDQGIFLWQDATVGFNDPPIDPGSDRSIFVWQTSDTGWTIRFAGGGSWASYSGTLTSDGTISNLTGFDLEPADQLALSANVISFSTTVGSIWVDGFSFTTGSPTDCIELTITQLSGATVLSGSNRTAVTAPYRICPSAGSGGGNVEGTWNLQASPGGSPAVFKGKVYSSLGFSSYAPNQLEDNDILLLNAAGDELAFDFNLWIRWEDGFKFSVPAGSQICVAIDPESSATNQIVFVGNSASPLAPPIDPVALVPCTIPTDPPPPPVDPPDTPNILLILTDDQRADTLWAMPAVQQELAAKGVTFENAYVTTPLCCPARSGFWSGGYFARNTGVLRNTGPNGGPDRFEDSGNTVSRLLQQAGYKTQFVGKYFALYAGYGGGIGVKVAPYIPPGWDSWVGRSVYATAVPWDEFRYVIGSTTSESGVGSIVSAQPQYTTYYERDRIIDFIKAAGNSPFYSVYSLSAPHEPATPASGDETLYLNYQYSSPGRSETDLSDKPWWVRNYNGEVHDDAFIRKQLQSLKAVDRSVEAIINELENLGKLDNTVIIYTSDNGFLWGEHGLWGKAKPHEEALRVPLVVRMPGAEPRVESQKLVAANLDVPQTILELAGIELTADGNSLIDLLSNPNAEWREELMFESYGHNVGGNGVWAAIRTDRWKYIDHPTGTDELYDLLNDPHELNSLHANNQYAAIKADLSSRLEGMKGLNIISFRWNLPIGKVGANYSYMLTAWGGEKPYEWSISSGNLPPGLSLNKSTGAVTGVPTQPGSYTVSFEVKASSLRRHSGKPEIFKSLDYVFTVND